VKSENEVQDLLGQVLAMVRGGEARADYHGGRSLATRFGENAITQNLSTAEESLRLRVSQGRRHGSAITNRLDAGSLRELVRRAEDIAAHAPEDPEAMPVLGPQLYPAALPRCFADVVALTPADLARQVAAAVAPVAARGWHAGGLHTAEIGVRAIATSRGLFAYDRCSSVSFSMTVHGPDGAGAASGQANAAADLDPAAIARDALADAVAAQRPRVIPPGDYTVIMAPDAVAELMGYLLWSLDARAAAEGTTPFAGQLNKKLFHEGVSLITDILDPEIPGRPFGEEGLPLRRTAWIEQGVLRRLFHHRFWAQHERVEPDAGLHPLTMTGGEGGLADLVAQCSRGLLVKHLWYIRHVDRRELLLTGMTRNGLFLVEDGRIVAPVKNLRFNESPLVFLRNIIAMSRPQRVDGDKFPGILSADFTFTSGTDSV